MACFCLPTLGIHQHIHIRYEYALVLFASINPLERIARTTGPRFALPSSTAPLCALSFAVKKNLSFLLVPGNVLEFCRTLLGVPCCLYL